ncbi:divisome protein SepX/GlpR [Amycolatopsis orientalis]|uniref:divisome protein SepX/GlpR n=1 Tax=Amycolatopsis orientalis TaxID=31958 RepID=UPI00041E74D5|nr:gephyrin-like molybdotransferase receptor GlpR [Amycolatopsis orientalis]
MPSSVIIVALAAAWLVVLVPMVARKRQQVARTADSALAARVVRSGSTRHEGPEEFAMAENTEPSVEDDLAELEAELDADLEDEEPEAEPLPQPSRAPRTERERQSAGYRPGRGGFDPEAADIAARAKYAFRQRVVIALLVLVVTTAVVAGFLTPMVWWANGVVDAVLIGYLAYLRRQVRIENEIRQRRLARYNSTRAPRRPSIDDDDESHEDIEVVAAERPEVVERKPSPMSRIRRQAVVVDLDDEDPAFHELDEPGTRPFRRAAGE